MNTYVLLAPDYAQIGDWKLDVRYFHARDLAHAREEAVCVWICDPEEIVCLVAFEGKRQALVIPNPKETRPC